MTTACATAPAHPASIPIQTDDVGRFFRVYDEAGGHPGAEDLQRDYFAQATSGLRQLTRMRNLTAENLALAIADKPELFLEARSCMSALPRVRERLDTVFERLLALYPAARRLPVTILVSRGRPLAIGGPEGGVQIAIEGMCSRAAGRFLGADIEDRFVHVIAHEFIHVQQPAELKNPTVLQRALEEGVAEFLGELISGRAANVAIFESVKGREDAIAARFLSELDSTDLSQWFDNTTDEDVGQLGYWAGYQLAKAYYEQAPDKQAAILDMLSIDEPHAFLERSGFQSSRPDS